MDDPTVSRTTIAQRYGVECPRQALTRILSSRCGPDAALAILDELAQAERCYQRAARVDLARRRVLRLRDADRAALREADPKDLARAERARQRDMAILDNAPAYIAGEWRSSNG